MSEWTHTVTGGPWPERIGRRCRVVDAIRNEYPWTGRSPVDAVVLIEDDPLCPQDREWTCTLGLEDITPIGGES